jgi:hypothetical protein
MEMKKMKVTPVQAQQWLDTANIGNRTQSHSNVAKFAADMRRGDWRNTHQNAIAFYDDGTLADGQHRLAAIVQSGVPIEMFVAYGLSRKDGSVIDQGRPRSAADALKIGGLVSMDKYHTQAVAIVKMVLWAEHKVSSMSVSQAADAIHAMREGIDFACHKTAAMKGPGLRTAPVFAAIAVAFYHVDTDKLERFCRVLCSGMPEVKEDEMLIRLRNWLLVSSGSGGGNVRIERYQTVMKIIDAYDKGLNISRIVKATQNTFKTGIFDD